MNWIFALLWSTLFSVPLLAQGVSMKKGAKVFYGEPSTCSRPATIRFDELKESTDEWKRIQSEGIKEGSATYIILMNTINTKINNAVKDYCKNAVYDMACEEGSIKNSNGLPVNDITDDILPNLVIFSRILDDFTDEALAFSPQGRDMTAEFPFWG